MVHQNFMTENEKVIEFRKRQILNH